MLRERGVWERAESMGGLTLWKAGGARSGVPGPVVETGGCRWGDAGGSRDLTGGGAQSPRGGVRGVEGRARFHMRGSAPKCRGPRVGRGIGLRRAGGGVGNPKETFTQTAIKN